MMVDADTDWNPRGATAFGTRLLIELAQHFTPPADGRPERQRAGGDGTTPEGREGRSR